MSARTRQTRLESLATSLDSGVGALQAVGLVLERLSETSREAVSLGRVKDALEADAPLHEALAKGGLLVGIEVPLVRAGERAGHAPQVLREIAADVGSVRAQVFSLGIALAYPAGLVLAAILIFPIPTAAFHGCGAYMGTVVPPLGMASLLIGGLVVAMRAGWLTWADVLRPTRSLPFFRRLHSDVVAGRLCRVCGRLLAAGLPVDAALAAASDVLPYADQRAALNPARGAIGDGASFSDALGDTALLPSETLIAISSAEQSGTLADALVARADIHREDGGRRAKALAAVFAATFSLVVMLAIAGQILATYLGLLTDMSAIFESPVSPRGRH